MRTPPPRLCQAAPALTLDENAICDQCGVFGAYAWEGATLCLSCYTERESCCAEREERGKPPSADAAQPIVR